MINFTQRDFPTGGVLHSGNLVRTNIQINGGMTCQTRTAR